MKPPSIYLLLSGKRKSGKDHVASRLLAQLTTSFASSSPSVSIVHLSSPIKRAYALANGLDYALLMSDGVYKEGHRRRMVDWSEGVREGEPAYFCDRAMGEQPPSVVYIVADCRRPTDLTYFHSLPNAVVISVRITASLAVRSARGFVHKEGVDDAATECALDSYDAWDYVLVNEGEVDVDPIVARVLSEIKTGV